MVMEALVWTTKETNKQYLRENRWCRNGGVLDHASPRRVSLALQAGSELLASSLTLPILSRHACSARFSSLSWFSASSWWTTNTSSLTGARGRAWVDVSAPPNTSCGLLSTGSSDWEQTLWLGRTRRPSCPIVANGWWHHCTLGLGCLVAQNFPMDDAHSEGVHNRLGPDISWRPATT